MATTTPFALYLTGQDGVTRDATATVRAINWSGNASTVSRVLSFSILQDAEDVHLPVVGVELGTAVELLIGGESVFGGIITEHARDSAAFEIDCTANDWGYYLKLNDTFLKVDKQTPEEITAQLCAEIGLEAGELAKTGVQLSHNFLPDNYYSIIETLYGLASAETGKEYVIQFRGRKIYVREKVQNSESILLVAGSNLLRCTRKESVGELKNRVKIYDDNDLVDSTVDDASSQALYGVFQTAILKSSYDDASAQANQILKEKAVSTDLSMECIGGSRLISGNTVVVQEPITKSYGLMWIRNDVHTWEKGIYRTKITASLESLVDESAAKEAAANTKPSASQAQPAAKSSASISGGGGKWLAETR